MGYASINPLYYFNFLIFVMAKPAGIFLLNGQSEMSGSQKTDGFPARTMAPALFVT